MALNLASPDLRPLSLADSDEFASLVRSASELGTPIAANVRYTSRNTVKNGLRLHFLEWGDPSAPPVLLVHGGHQSAHSWDLVSLSLADRYHVFALDQRGHGDSEWARDGDYRTSTLAGDLLAFVEGERISSPIVVGHSLGGLVSMTLLRDHPGLARALVVVDVGPEPSGDGAQSIWSFIQSAREFDHLEDFIQRVQAQDPFRSRSHIERTVRYNMVRRIDGKYVSKCDSAIANRGRHDDSGRVSLADISALTMPTLVLRGEHSQVLTAEGAERFAQHLPNGQLVTVPECGHNVHSQNTVGFLAALDAFLAGL